MNDFNSNSESSIPGFSDADLTANKKKSFFNKKNLLIILLSICVIAGLIVLGVYTDKLEKAVKLYNDNQIWALPLVLFVAGLILVKAFWKKAHAPDRETAFFGSVPNPNAKLVFTLRKFAGWVVLFGATLAVYALLIYFLPGFNPFYCLMGIYALVILIWGIKSIKAKKTDVETKTMVQTVQTVPQEQTSSTVNLSLLNEKKPGNRKKIAVVTLGLLILVGAAYFFYNSDFSFSKGSSQSDLRKKFIADSIALSKKIEASWDSTANIKAKTKSMLRKIAEMKADSINRAKLQGDFISADTSLCNAKDENNAVLAEYLRLNQSMKSSTEIKKNCTTELHVSLAGNDKSISVKKDGVVVNIDQ